MKTTTLIGLFVGLTAIGALIAWQGFSSVFGLLDQAGWPLLLVCLFAIPEQALTAEAWRRLFPPDRLPRFSLTLMASWMGSAVNTLLPVASIGGEVAKARVLTHWSHAGTDTTSTMIVDKTVQALSVLVWTSCGIFMLIYIDPNSPMVEAAVTGAVLLGGGIGGFIAVQLAGGLSFVAKILHRFRQSRGRDGLLHLVESAGITDQSIRAIYKRPGAYILSCFLRLGGRFILVGEILFVSHLMGHPIGILEIVMIEGLAAGLRGVAFAVPNGFGVQEGAFIAVGALLGLPADLMLAISLATRVREILPCVPFLLLWQHTEGKALWRRRQVSSQED